MNEFERECDSIGLKMNVEKSKVLVINKDLKGSCEKVRLSKVIIAVRFGSWLG